MRAAIVLAVILMVAGCSGGGCHIPAKRSIYNLACDQLAREKSVPAGARPAPMEEAKVGIGKNAASVDLPYTFTDASGQTVRGSQTFWIKRIARTWTVVRSHPVPVYGDAPAPAETATRTNTPPAEESAEQ